MTRVSRSARELQQPQRRKRAERPGSDTRLAKQKIRKSVTSVAGTNRPSCADGDNVHIKVRWSAGKSELIRQCAQELVALVPNVILANSTPVIEVFHNLTTSIPVVFALAIDPVALGHVKSLAHPGGNFTGFAFIDPDLIGKWMELLKEVVPGTRRAGLLYNPATSPFCDKFVRRIEAARAAGAIEIFAMHVSTDGEMAAAIRALAQTPGSGLMFGPDPFNQVRIKQIAQLAGQNRLPAVSVYRPFTTEGGLMAYGRIPPTYFAVRPAMWTVEVVGRASNRRD